jgi:predicted metal-dependent peptidase
VWCDTEISVQVVEAAEELAPKGGGGTMFSPVFEWVNENRPHTKGVVYVTDGYCSDFGEEPTYPVLWVLTAENGGFTPPFGEVVCVL